MPIIYTPPEPKPKCIHEDRPTAADVPKGARYYCDYCHKVFMVGKDCYGFSVWRRWPMNWNRAFFIAGLLGLVGVVLLIIFTNT